MKLSFRSIIFVALLFCAQMVASADTVIKGDDAYKWVGEHLDSLANSYMLKSGNVLDPDDVRDELKTIGYNGLNVTDYIMASRQIDSLVLVRLMDRAEADGNKTIVYMMGSTGAGKTTSLYNNPELVEMTKEAGVVYDGAFISISSFETRLDMAMKRGFKASIVFVHNDPETGFENVIRRMIKSNRSMSLYYYIYCYPRFMGRIAYLLNKHPEVTLYCLDNSRNKGGVRVSNEEALSWDYSITESLEKSLRSIMQRWIESGQLTTEQIEALEK